MTSKTHYQVRDTRTNSAVRGCEAMMFDDNARHAAQRLNRRARTKSPRYVIIRVDPDNLPVHGTPHNAADIVSEF